MENVLLLRLNDHDSDELVRPADSAGNLAALEKTGADMPAIVEAELGYGRAFVSADATGLAAVDLDSGATLLTRNASIQVALSWDVAAAAVYGTPGTIYARGKGTSAAEYLSAGLELRVINAASRIGEIRWIWQDLAGNLKTQIGGHFQAPASGELLITATRRWVSSSRVVLRYYLGDALLAEVESSDGEIAGGTTGTTSIGTRYNAAGGAWFRHFDGVIDELRVVDGELAEEEVRATWRRITVDQPRGYQLLRELHDPGFPISRDPASRAQRETRLYGHALGYAAAQAENVRENILPDRAYGELLKRWERITKQSPRAGEDLDTRRGRVVGRIRQRLGVSILGLEDALAELLDTDPVNLSFLAFDQTIAETWETLNVLRWRHDPIGQCSIVSNALRMATAAPGLAWSSWQTSLASVGGNGRGVAMISKLAPTTIGNRGEAGLVFIDRAHGNAFLFGLRNDAGAYQIVTSELVGGAAGAATVHAAPGLVPLWLRMFHDGATGNMRIAYSIVGADGPFTTVEVASGLSSFQWAGFYARQWAGGGAPTVSVDVDDTRIRAPFGDRAFRFYVVRDPAEPGSPDYDGANAVIRGLRHTFTLGNVVRTTVALYDDESTGYDLEPMGGI